MQAIVWTDFFVSYSDNIVVQQENIRKIAPENSEIYKLNFDETTVKEIRTDLKANNNKITITCDRVELRERSRFGKVFVELYFQEKMVQKISLENIGVMVSIGSKTFDNIGITVEGTDPIKFQIGFYKPIPAKSSDEGCIVC